MKRFLKKLSVFVLTLAMISALAMPVPMRAQAAQKTITVTSANASTAKKVNNAIVKGAAVRLKVKGDASASKKLVKKLENKIKTTNQQGVIFQYKKGSKSGKYYMYTISAQNAKLYTNSVKFIKKLFTNFKAAKNLPSGLWYDGKYNRGYSAIGDVTELEYYHALYTVYKSSKSTQSFTGFIASESKKSNYFFAPGYYSTKAFIKAHIGQTYTPFDINTMHYNKSQARIYSVAFAAKNFSRLSDAMKVWVIATSGYFGCSYSRNATLRKFDASSQTFTYKNVNLFCMVYTYGVQYATQGAAGVKKLLKNSAKGVCQAFAEYEVLLFTQLGIKSYFNANYGLNHAWSVVKAKNSKNKYLWIPFDYGIGPSNIVSAYTEASAYSVYLYGISGAPSKRNFKQSDFI